MWIFSHKKNPENWAGGVAIVVVNLIVGGYCYSAFIEDSDDVNDEKEESRCPDLRWRSYAAASLYTKRQHKEVQLTPLLRLVYIG